MTLIRVEYEGVRYDLDVLETTPIRLDISAIENNDIGEIFGAASQTFTLPGSKKNNQFFKHAYKVGTETVPGLGESVPCWVISESDTLLEGSLYLNSIVKTKNEGVNYEVTITNNVVTFNESIKTKRVQDLNWDSYDHSFSMLNVTASWNNDLFGGDIYYPLIDQGRDGQEGTGSLPNVQINKEDDNREGFINSTISPLQVRQLTPAISVKTVLDKVFESGQFTYETSLEDLFRSTYILPKQTETLSVKGSSFTSFTFAASSSIDIAFTSADNYVTASTPTEVFNNGDAWSGGPDYVYTVPSNGTYAFRGTLKIETDPEDTTAIYQLRIQNISDNTNIAYINSSPREVLDEFTLDTGEVNLLKDDKIQLQARYLQGEGEGELTSYILSGSNFSAYATPLNFETGIIKMGEQFDPQVKCIDIIKGIAQKFNLVFEPDYTKNRVIKIESYKDWVLQGNRKDWTNKIQQAKKIFLESPLSSQPKTLEFQDAKDNDKLSKQVIDNAEGLQWGTSIVDAISDVPQGTKKVGEYFAPIVLERMPGGEAQNVIPQLYKTDNSEVGRKTFKFKPRIGYKVNGTLPVTAYIGNNITPFTDYATISNYDTIPIVSGSTKNLHWNETFYPPTFNADATGSITAYDEYWSNYVNDLYRDDNKILKADIYFEPYELRDIKLNDAIFVEDSYYRINKISGYNLTGPDIVSVELIGLSSGELPSVDINCNFDFEWGLTTSTTTLIPPVQPTTSTAPPISASVTVTDASNEACDNGSLEFSINGGYTPYTLVVATGSYSGGTGGSWNVLISNLENGTYPWSITDNVGNQITGSDSIICTYVPPTTTTTTSTTTTTTTLAPQSFDIKAIYSGSTQPFTGSVDLVAENYEFNGSLPQVIDFGSVSGSDVEFTTQSVDLFNLYNYVYKVNNILTSSNISDTHYGRFKFWEDGNLSRTDDELIPLDGNISSNLLTSNAKPGYDLFSITSSFEYIPLPSKQIEMTLNLDGLFGTTLIESASLYYRRPTAGSKTKILEYTGSLSSGSFTFKTNRTLPTLQDYGSYYYFEIELKAPTGETFKFKDSPNNRITWIQDGTPVELDAFDSSILYSSESANSINSGTSNPFTGWGPVSNVATMSVEVDTLQDFVIFYEGFSCVYPFANSDLIAASSSLSTGDVVRVGFPDGDACYTVLRQTTQKEYTFLVEEVFNDCATCSGSL